MSNAIPLSRFKDAEVVVQQYVASIPPQVTLERILKPDYWVHVAWKLKPLAIINAFSEDNTWEATLRVRDVGQRWASVALLQHVEYPTLDNPDKDENFSVQWGGPVHLWRIVRGSDGVVIEKEFGTKEAAYARVAQLMQRAA